MFVFALIVASRINFNCLEELKLIKNQIFGNKHIIKLVAIQESFWGIQIFKNLILFALFTKNYILTIETIEHDIYLATIL